MCLEELAGILLLFLLTKGEVLPTQMRKRWRGLGIFVIHDPRVDCLESQFGFAPRKR